MLQCYIQAGKKKTQNNKKTHNLGLGHHCIMPEWLQLKLMECYQNKMDHNKANQPYPLPLTETEHADRS